ncbi:MAG TPA: type II CAAX endopeptidase family protein [Hyphomicrobiaceae bacterium]|nr:type II CAAX endopeptidase family protein [Hyphomicrobiaceae bacterium]
MPGRQPSAGDELRRAISAIVVVLAILFGAAVTVGAASGLIGVADGTLGNREQWIALLAFQAMLVVLLVVFARLFGPLQQTLMLVRPRVNAWGIARALAVTAGVLGAFSLMTGLAFPEAMRQDLAVFQKLLSGVSMWLPVVVLCVGAPVSEELVFRGFLLGQLAQTRLGFGGAAVIATAAWTAIHMQYTAIGLADVFVAGMVFSWTLWRTGSLWVPILFHALYNAIVLAVISQTSWLAV